VHGTLPRYRITPRARHTFQIRASTVVTSRLDRALLGLVILLSISWIVGVCFRPSGTVDVWWTLQVGDYIRTERQVPRTLLWALDAVRDLPYVCHGWLGALAYSSVAHAFGLDAVPAVPTLVALALFGSLAALARQLGASWLLAVAVSDLALFSVLPRMNCRIEVFGLLYFALALNLAARQLGDGRVAHVAWFVPLGLLWVNSHGSFLLLVALLPLVAAGLSLDAWRRAGFRWESLLASVVSKRVAALAAVWLLVAAATLANPYGLDLIRSVLDQATSKAWHAAIQEWQPLYAQSPLPSWFVVPAFLVLVALALGYRRLSFVPCLLAAATIVLALSARRHLPLFGIGAAFVLGSFAGGVELGRRGRGVLAAVLVGCLLAANGAAAPPWSFAERRLSRNPSQDVTSDGLDFIRAHVRGNVLNRWSLGGLLIYFGHPQIRVSIDSRADPYPLEYFRRYRRALVGTAQDTLAFVDAYAIDAIIVDRTLYEHSFRPKLAGLRGFRPVYVDERTAVLSRDAAAIRPSP
jgi:hypothetical protein